MFAGFARRVAAHDPESPAFGIRLHERPHVPHADNSQTLFDGLPSLPTGEMHQHGSNPLKHSAGVAPGSRLHPDAVSSAPVHVDMVESDGRRRHEPHARPAQQRFVAAGPGPDNQRVGIGHVRGSYSGSGQTAHLGPRVQHPLQKGYRAVGNDGYFSDRIFHCSAKGRKKTKNAYL